MGGVLDPLRELASREPSVAWSATVLTSRGDVVDALDADTVLPTASIGKLFLLLTVMDGFERGALDRDEMLAVHADDGVADSGLLQHLDGQVLSVLDLCRFVGAVSDNLATNVLLRRVGLVAVHAVTTQLGIASSALHDSVRDTRGPEHTPFLSTGCAAELAALIRRIAGGEAVSPVVSDGMVEVLRLNTDLSMVASAFALDPLAHGEPDLGLRLFNKTGTQDGTRADVGWVEETGQGSGVAYAVIARFDDSASVRRHVLDAMAATGHVIGELVRGA